MDLGQDADPTEPPAPVAEEALSETPVLEGAPVNPVLHLPVREAVRSRYLGLATNPFSRGDAEREWPLIGQAALWSNLTDEE